MSLLYTSGDAYSGCDDSLCPDAYSNKQTVLHTLQYLPLYFVPSAWGLLCLMPVTCELLEMFKGSILIQDEEDSKPGKALLWKAVSLAQRLARSYTEMSPHDVCRAHQLFAGAALLQRYA